MARCSTRERRVRSFLLKAKVNCSDDGEGELNARHDGLHKYVYCFEVDSRGKPKMLVSRILKALLDIRRQRSKSSMIIVAVERGPNQRGVLIRAAAPPNPATFNFAQLSASENRLVGGAVPYRPPSSASYYIQTVSQVKACALDLATRSTK